MSGQKILIVDDEPFNVDYLEQELDDLNYITHSANNGREALDSISSDPPDLILLDIMMPVMDGFDVLRQLKKDPETRDIPVIVISANSDLQSMVKGIQMGAEDYLPKPFEPTLLHARITSSLEKKQLRDLQKKYLKSLEREFEIAHEIQMDFLPKEIPSVDGWEIAAFFKGAREVAGDYYDAFLLTDGNIFFVIGDVCGKGVGAALYMTLFRSLIRATATSQISNSADGINDVPPLQRLENTASFTNNYITNTHGDESTFSTLFMGIVDRKTGVLTFVNGGNEPPLIIRSDGSVIPLHTTGPVLGIFPEASFQAKEIPLMAGDLLVAFTDGIPDALNDQNVPFGTEHFLEDLIDQTLSADQILQSISRQVFDYIDKADQFDDITLIAIKRSD